MPHRVRARGWRWWLAALCVAAGVAQFGAADAGAITSAQCDARVNDTPAKLLPCIKTADLWNHMQNFQAIADANPGPVTVMPSRNSGEPGYKASVDYVAAAMEAAGYNVTIQTYTFDYFAYQGPPTWSEVSPTAHDYALSTEWNPGQSIGNDDAPIFSRPEGSSSRRLRRLRERLHPCPTSPVSWRDASR